MSSLERRVGIAIAIIGGAEAVLSGIQMGRKVAAHKDTSGNVLTLSIGLGAAAAGAALVMGARSGERRTTRRNVLVQSSPTLQPSQTT